MRVKLLFHGRFHFGGEVRLGRELNFPKEWVAVEGIGEKYEA